MYENLKSNNVISGAKSRQRVQIVGGGLAGCEAAWQIANRGIYVNIYEMRPIVSTVAHNTENLCELVCSNSFRSGNSQANAVGILHEELRRAGSLILRTADNCQVPAGGALAVDRKLFSLSVQSAIERHPNIKVIRKEICELPSLEMGQVLIASGPLTSNALASSISDVTGSGALAFFDSIAPIIYRESIDLDIAWFQSRYDKNLIYSKNGAYINCPLNKSTYELFVQNLLSATPYKDTDPDKPTPYFEGCLPIEVMAERGLETLRYGPLKPVGLMNPHTNQKPHAVVQLRQDNISGSLFNIVGFQTKMNYQDQQRVFRMIPGLKNATFARLGGMHRNTFLNSPKLLDESLRLKAQPNIRFAGQITGVEGYVESSAIGLLAGRFIAEDINYKSYSPPPKETALGALLRYITGENVYHKNSFQPMNINFGLFPEFTKNMTKKERRITISKRALDSLNDWLTQS